MTAKSTTSARTRAVPSRRVAKFAATAGLAATLVGASAAAASADGTGTVNDPWVPTKTAHISCDSATRFGNYTDGSHNLTSPLPASDYGTLYRGAAVDVRYESGDRYAVMAMYHDANTRWAFILRSCVQFG